MNMWNGRSTESNGRSTSEEMTMINLQDVIIRLDLIAAATNAYKVEEVTSVIRRQFTRRDGEEVEVIDFYPPWNEMGTYGELKVAHEYMDHDWQRARFEHYAGICIADLPVYEAQQALRRTYGRQHPSEVSVNPFRLMLLPRQDAEGNDKKTLIINYTSMGRRARRETQQPSTPPAAPVRARTPDTPQQPAKPQTKQKTAADWEAEALEATDPLIFDASFAKSEPWFKDSAAVFSFRDLIFGPFVAEHTAGYVVGLKAYKDERVKANGSRDAHNRAKTLALQAFRNKLGMD